MNKSFLCLMILVVTSSGCAVSNSMRLSDKISIWNPAKERTAKKKTELSDEDRQNPQTMAAIWNDALLERVEGDPKRGFGGRIYFYDDQSQSIPVDGELVIYAFDADSETPDEPDRRFVFKQDTLQQHYSESALGGSYSVWLPWDSYNGSFDKSITLVPVFVSKSGEKLTSSQSICHLAGTSPRPVNPDANEPFEFLGSSSAVVGMTPNRRDRSGAVQSASFNQRANEKVKPTGMKVTELNLTRNLQRHIGLAANAPNPQLGALSQVSSANQEPWQPFETDQAAAPTERTSKATTAPINDSHVAPASAPVETQPNASASTESRPVFGAPGVIR